MAATSSSSAPFIESQRVIQPRRLKDFLQDQNLPFPCSRRSAISVFFHAAVSSVKSSYILRRSISRRFSKKIRSTSRVPEPKMERTTSVTVKDILRWRSFRDLADPVETNVPPLTDFIVESPRCTTTTTTTTSAGTPRSSWCDSDFTVDDSPVFSSGFSGDMEVTGEKNFHINIAGVERNDRDPKDGIILVEEDEQFSPISVLDVTHEHEETFSPFRQILADLKRRSILLNHFENLIEVDDNLIELNDTESFKIEERAIQLMDHVKTTSSIEEWDLHLDCLLIDFFRDELITSKEEKNNDKLETRVLKVAKSWVRGEDDGSLKWEMGDTIQEMDKRWNWKDFEDDKKEIAIEIEKITLNFLLDELSIDLVNN